MIVHTTWIVNSLLSVIVAMTCAVGDKALKTMTLQPMTKAVLDNSVHGLVGMFSALIVLTDHFYKLHVAVACMIISSVIDVDHFVAARSFKLVDATSLNSRPFLHNSMIPVVLIAILFCLHFSPKGESLIIWIIIATVAFVTHHLRDANRRGLWFPPVGNTIALKDSVYIGLIVATPYLMKYFVPNTSRLNSAAIDV